MLANIDLRLGSIYLYVQYFKDLHLGKQLMQSSLDNKTCFMLFLIKYKSCSMQVNSRLSLYFIFFINFIYKNDQVSMIKKNQDAWKRLLKIIVKLLL